jgi:hypothetical protein
VVIGSFWRPPRAAAVVRRHRGAAPGRSITCALCDPLPDWAAVGSAAGPPAHDGVRAAIRCRPKTPLQGWARGAVRCAFHRPGAHTLPGKCLHEASPDPATVAEGHVRTIPHRARPTSSVSGRGEALDHGHAPGDAPDDRRLLEHLPTSSSVLPCALFRLAHASPPCQRHGHVDHTNAAIRREPSRAVSFLRARRSGLRPVPSSGLERSCGVGRCSAPR